MRRLWATKTCLVSILDRIFAGYDFRKVVLQNVTYKLSGRLNEWYLSYW